MAALAAIFDLDGTLLDTLGDLTAAVNYALGELSCPRRTREEVRSFIGNGFPTLLRRSLPAGADEEMHRQAMALFSAYYGENMTKTTAPYPGIPWLLERLSEDGVRLGVVSNKKHDATQPLCRRFFGALLGCALGARDDSERKPNPSMLLRAIELLGTDEAHTVYIGDSDVDIQTAQAAGIPCCPVGWGYRTAAFLRENGAKEVFETPEALYNRLTALFAQRG